MAKPITPHPHSDRPAFDRLMLLIATILEQPGIGSPDPQQLPPSGQHHDALTSLLQALQTFAQTHNHPLPAYSTATLRKDLQILRHYHILENHMYRWGYYLGTGALTPPELSTALQALALQAQTQGDPNLRRMHHTIQRRLHNLNLPEHLTYPIRSQLDQLILHIDPDETRHLGIHKHSLYDQLDRLETAIIQAQSLELCPIGKPPFRAYPLQLLYHEIAWYLLYEISEPTHPTSHPDHQPIGHFGIRRIDRLSDHCEMLPHQRDLPTQQNQLNSAHNLLKNGWGLFLGDPTAQAEEREGILTLTPVKVRFYGPTIRPIEEGNRRHPRQKLRKGPKDPEGKPQYIDYEIHLPPRSLDEFFRWVHRFTHNAQVLAPTDWVEIFRQRAQAQLDRYNG